MNKEPSSRTFTAAEIRPFIKKNADPKSDPKGFGLATLYDMMPYNIGSIATLDYFNNGQPVICFNDQLAEEELAVLPDRDAFPPVGEEPYSGTAYIAGKPVEKLSTRRKLNDYLGGLHFKEKVKGIGGAASYGAGIDGIYSLAHTMSSVASLGVSAAVVAAASTPIVWRHQGHAQKAKLQGQAEEFLGDVRNHFLDENSVIRFLRPASESEKDIKMASIWAELKPEQLETAQELVSWLDNRKALSISFDKMFDATERLRIQPGTLVKKLLLRDHDPAEWWMSDFGQQIREFSYLEAQHTEKRQAIDKFWLNIGRSINENELQAHYDERERIKQQLLDKALSMTEQCMHREVQARIDKLAAIPKADEAHPFELQLQLFTNIVWKGLKDLDLTDRNNRTTVQETTDYLSYIRTKDNEGKYIFRDHRQVEHLYRNLCACFAEGAGASIPPWEVTKHLTAITA